MQPNKLFWRNLELEATKQRIGFQNPIIGAIQAARRLTPLALCPQRVFSTLWGAAFPPEALMLVLLRSPCPPRGLLFPGAVRVLPPCR